MKVFIVYQPERDTSAIHVRDVFASEDAASAYAARKNAQPYTLDLFGKREYKVISYYVADILEVTTPQEDLT